MLVPALAPPFAAGEGEGAFESDDACAGVGAIPAVGTLSAPGADAFIAIVWMRGAYAGIVAPLFVAHALAASVSRGSRREATPRRDRALGLEMANRM